MNIEIEKIKKSEIVIFNGHKRCFEKSKDLNELDLGFFNRKFVAVYREGKWVSINDNLYVLIDE